MRPATMIVILLMMGGVALMLSLMGNQVQKSTELGTAARNDLQGQLDATVSRHEALIIEEAKARKQVEALGKELAAAKDASLILTRERDQARQLLMMLSASAATVKSASTAIEAR